MNSPSFNRHRLLELVDLYATDEIAPEEVAELEELLRGSQEARRSFGRYIQFEVELAQRIECNKAFQVLLTAIAGDPAEALDLQDSSVPASPPATSAGSEVSSTAWTRAKVWLCKPEILSVTVAALVIVSVISTLAVFSLPQRISEPTHHAVPVTVARLTAVHNAKWADGQTGARLGAHLPAGHRMELKQGLAEVTFRSGARVTMKAPATLVVEGEGVGSLELGHFIAQVPAKAVGFILSTQTAVITDLGTEFGVTTEPSGTTRVLVFDGHVEVDAGDRMQPLKAGEGLLVTGGPDGVGFERQWNEELASSLQAAHHNLAQTIVSFAQSGAVGSFECSATDLAETSRSLAKIELRAGSAAYGSDVSELVDGDVYGGQGSDLTTHSFTPVDGAVVVITFDTSVHAAGYDIDSIVSLSGTFQSRVKHHYSIESRAVGGDFEPAFAIRESLPGNENPLGTGEVRIVTKRPGGPLVEGIDALRITFHDVASAEFPETMYREIDVFGAPTLSNDDPP